MLRETSDSFGENVYLMSHPETWANQAKFDSNKGNVQEFKMIILRLTMAHFYVLGIEI